MISWHYIAIYGFSAKEKKVDFLFE